MNEPSQTFARFRRAHSLLYAPQFMSESVELIPVAISEKVLLDRARDFLSKTAGNTQSFIVLFLKTLLKDRAAPSAVVNFKQPANGLPAITVRPDKVTWDVSLFEERLFQCFAPQAQSAEIFWMIGKAEPAQHEASADSQAPLIRRRRADLTRRATMDAQPSGWFFSILGLPDGNYRVGYRAADCLLPVPSHAQAVYLQADGVLADVSCHTPALTLTFQNELPSEIVVRLETEATWINLPPTALLPPDEAVTILLRIRHEHLKVGINEAELKLMATFDAETQMAGLSLTVQAQARGATPSLHVSPSDLGSLKQGIDRVQMECDISTRGVGEIKCMLLIQHSEEIFDFTFNGDDGQRSFHSPIIIDSHKLPYDTHGKIKLTLISNSYLANYRLQEIEVPYRLLYLNKSLPALLFGSLPRGTTSSLRLEVWRSDGQPIDLGVTLTPQSNSNYLSAYRISNNTYSFRFDTRLLKDARAVREIVLLTDRLSGLSSYIEAIAEINDS